jgi:hypothetical protein
MNKKNMSRVSKQENNLVLPPPIPNEVNRLLLRKEDIGGIRNVDIRNERIFIGKVGIAHPRRIVINDLACDFNDPIILSLGVRLGVIVIVRRIGNEEEKRHHGLLFPFATPIP